MALGVVGVGYEIGTIPYLPKPNKDFSKTKGFKDVPVLKKKLEWAMIMAKIT